MLGWLSQPTMPDVGIDAVDRAMPATDAPLYRLSCITFNATTAGARRYAVHSKFTRRRLAWPTAGQLLVSGLSVSLPAGLKAGETLLQNL